MNGGFDRIICVDWGRDHGKRRAWVADVVARRVAPLPIAPTLRALVAYALSSRGRTLVGIDAALGVPEAWLRRACAQTSAWSGCSRFLDWLRVAIDHPRFLQEARTASEWRWDRPFIAVPGGAGSLQAFWDRTGGTPLLRRIDARTGAKPVFIVSGIPGSVGSGTRALWVELARLLEEGTALRTWPFDGGLDEIGGRVVLGEIYPRASYALALAEALPTTLRPLPKTDPDVRAMAVDELLAAPWVATHGVTIEGSVRARENDDDFDALLSAAGLLRCVLEHVPLDDGSEGEIEGGMLGASALTWTPARASSPARARDSAPARSGRASGAREQALYPCPIAGCKKVFVSSRGGWDAHVASLAQHPTWHPDERDPEARKAMFRAQYAGWFGG